MNGRGCKQDWAERLVEPCQPQQNPIYVVMIRGKIIICLNWAAMAEPLYLCLALRLSAVHSLHSGQQVLPWKVVWVDRSVPSDSTDASFARFLFSFSCLQLHAYSSPTFISDPFYFYLVYLILLLFFSSVITYCYYFWDYFSLFFSQPKDNYYIILQIKGKLVIEI